MKRRPARLMPIPTDPDYEIPPTSEDQFNDVTIDTDARLQSTGEFADLHDDEDEDEDATTGAPA